MVKSKRIYIVVFALCLVSVYCSFVTDNIGNCSVKPYEINEIVGQDLNRISLVVIDKNGNRKAYPYAFIEQIAKNPGIDFNRKTLLFASGYLDSPVFPFMQMMAQEYHKMDYNFLALDPLYYYTMKYPLSARYIYQVGKIAADMLFKLTKHGLNPKKLEIIGLSLGGQTMAIIAKEYRKLTGKNFTRMTALDAAAPCFENAGPEERLQKSDADFIDVIVTNTDFLGISEPVGHVNFYINGGANQPGDLWWFPCLELCSHIRVYFLWISALRHRNQDPFIAIQCDSAEQASNHGCFGRKPLVTNVFGYNVDKSRQGVFYLTTDFVYPYFLGRDGLTSKYKYTRSENGLPDPQYVRKLSSRRARQKYGFNIA